MKQTNKKRSDFIIFCMYLALFFITSRSLLQFQFVYNDDFFLRVGTIGFSVAKPRTFYMAEELGDLFYGR